MITNIRIRNFKGLEDVQFELGAAPVVLIGPNNCGKTSILQAMTMWHVGAKEWQRQYDAELGKRRGFRGVGITPDKFPALPIPNLNLLWRERRVMEGMKGRVKICIQVDGETNGEKWRIGTQFQYHKNIVYCAPMLEGENTPTSKSVAEQWGKHLPNVRFLQPMSGIAKEEYRLLPESADAEISRGNTAGVLRNACYHLLHPERSDRGKAEAARSWNGMVQCIRDKFGVTLDEPTLDGEGRVLMSYKDISDSKRYDLSSGGRGFHQTLLLLSYLHGHPNSVILMDEPDAHLEIIRQRDNFALLREIAESMSSQLVIASHSEVVMSEATLHDGFIVEVFGGKTNNLHKREDSDRLRKWLTKNEWSLYYLAKQRGHIAFLEGSTDVDILAAFSEKCIGKSSAEMIRRAHLTTIGNNDTGRVKNLFRNLRKALPHLRGYALFDKVDAKQLREQGMRLECWQRKEIENYLLVPEVLYRYAKARDNASRQTDNAPDNNLKLPLAPNSSPAKNNLAIMREAVKDIVPRLALKDQSDPYWHDEKMSNRIVQIMKRFSKLRGDAGTWSKWKCHTLVQYMTTDEIPDEVREKIIQLLAVIDPDFNPEKT